MLDLAPEGRALAQIKGRGYADKYRAEGIPIHLIGVEMSRERRTLVGFEVESLDGDTAVVRKIRRQQLAEDGIAADGIVAQQNPQVTNTCVRHRVRRIVRIIADGPEAVAGVLPLLRAWDDLRSSRGASVPR